MGLFNVIDKYKLKINGIAYRLIEINTASFNLRIFFVNNVFLLFFMSSLRSFVWFQKFDAPLETREIKTPKINRFNFAIESSVNLQEMKNKVMEKIGIGEIRDWGVKRRFIISDIFFTFNI